MELNLQERVAFVTGGGSGIGRAVSLRLAREGAAVVVVDLRDDRAQATADEIVQSGGHALAVACDTSDPEQVAIATAKAGQWRGPITAVCLAAGIGASGSIQEMDFETWRRVMSVNLDAQFSIMKELIGPMVAAGGGSVVTVGSTGAVISRHADSAAVYGVSKAGVAQFTRHLAARYGEHGVRANCVHPGSTTTNFGESIVGARAMTHQPITAPLNRRADPQEIADPIVFLLSDRASFITGQALSIDGGLTAV